jgi:hypothetical protein
MQTAYFTYDLDNVLWNDQNLPSPLCWVRHQVSPLGQARWHTQRRASPGALPNIMGKCKAHSMTIIRSEAVVSQFKVKSMFNRHMVFHCYSSWWRWWPDTLLGWLSKGYDQHRVVIIAVEISFLCNFVAVWPTLAYFCQSKMPIHAWCNFFSWIIKHLHCNQLWAFCNNCKLCYCLLSVEMDFSFCGWFAIFDPIILLCRV